MKMSMSYRWAAIGAASGLLLAALILMVGTGHGEAHAVQVASVPAANAQLARSPERIAITFSEPVEPSVTSVLLWDGTPKQIPLANVTFADSKNVDAVVSEALPMGVYTVVWRNLSTVDGHTWSGSFPFTVLGPNGEVPSGGAAVDLTGLIDPPSDLPSTLDSVARWVVLLGSAVMLGGAAYVLFVAYPAARVLDSEASQSLRSISRAVLLVTGAIAAFLVLEGTLLQLALQADRLGGLDRIDEILFDTRPGRYLIARQALLLAGLAGIVALWRSESRAPAFALLLAGSVGVLLTQSLVSHAGASVGSVWTTTADFLHLLAAALWVGGLVHVGLAMPRWLDELKGGPPALFAAESFRRFSMVAVVSVVILIASGVLSALAQFTARDQLWTTNYGWSLIAKMAAMLPLLAVGGLNAFVLRPRVVAAARDINSAGERSAGAAAGLQRLLANTVRAEAVLGIVVLVAVAVLTQLEPPRAAVEAEKLASLAPPPADSSDPAPSDDDRGYYLKANQAGGLVISLKVDPATVGENDFEVGLGSEFGGIGEVLETLLEFENTTQEVGPSRLVLPLAGSAKYVASASNLSLPGEWDVTVSVRRRGQDDVSSTFTLPLAATGAGEPGEEPPPAAAGPSAASESIWEWPFKGGRSIGAIAVLAGVAALAGFWALLRFLRPA